MHNESYTLILNSQNEVNRDNSSGNINSYKYYINWSVVLPKKFASFNVSYTLKSINTLASITSNAFVSIDFGQTNKFDQTSNQSKILGITVPVAFYQTTTTMQYYYISTLTENFPVTISYPTNSFITVSFTNFDTVTPFVMYHYVIQLTFTPIQISNQEQIFMNSI